MPMIQAQVQRVNDDITDAPHDKLRSVDCADANCFYDANLLTPALPAYGPAGNVITLEARDDSDVLIGSLPVIADSRHGRFPVRHTANWIYPHCYYGAPLLRTGQEGQAWRGVLTQLDRAPWSGDFLYLRLLDPDAPAARALLALCRAEGRPVLEVARYERAMLRSPLDADSYWTQTVRSKKRKELRRQQNRLSECGTITRHALTDAAALNRWCDDFLRLERSGWKGDQGTALGSSDRDEAFFRTACVSAFKDGGLDMLRIDCDGNAIAMLVNFVGPNGGFSFKIAIDPAYARYSPGVLIEMDNLTRILGEHRAPWMDSCAAPDHPMIDSLWGERRTMAQYRVQLRKGGLSGIKAAATFRGIAMAEGAARMFRNRGKQ